MDGLINFFAPTPGIGTAGQPAREQFAGIADAGYAAVVNLAMHNSDKAIAGEKVLVHCAVNAKVAAFTSQYFTLKRGLASSAVTSPLLAEWQPRMNDAWRGIMRLSLADIEAQTVRIRGRVVRNIRV